MSPVVAKQSQSSEIGALANTYEHSVTANLPGVDPGFLDNKGGRFVNFT